MHGHFVDLKQAYVMGMMEALQRYDISCGVPFLVFKELPAMNAVHTYIRTMRTGYGKPKHKPRRKVPFIELAVEHGLASPDTADKTYRRALEKMRKALSK